MGKHKNLTGYEWYKLIKSKDNAANTLLDESWGGYKNEDGSPVTKRQVLEAMFKVFKPENKKEKP